MDQDSAQTPEEDMPCLKHMDTSPNYIISSHRPLIGRLFILGRRLIHGEVKRYVDLMIEKQSSFNRCIGDILKSVSYRIASAENRLDVAEEAIVQVGAKTSKLEGSLDFVVGHLNKAVDDKLWLSNLLEKRVKTGIDSLNVEPFNYFLFEEKYRGVEEEIKHRQEIFVEYFACGKHVLDIGCGRGEFLELLSEHGISGRGIDVNEDMILYCQHKGLEVEQADAISYLSSIPDKSLDGIFMGQVIEHLQPKELMGLIKLCYDKMEYGTYFIAETVNPLCLSVFAGSFTMDLSHVKPIHPETIKFLLESVGFRNIEFKFFSEFPEEIKLKQIDMNDGMPDAEKNKILIMNQNTKRLNELLFGFQDYAVIGKK